MPGCQPMPGWPMAQSILTAQTQGQIHRNCMLFTTLWTKKTSQCKKTWQKTFVFLGSQCRYLSVGWSDRPPSGGHAVAPQRHWQHDFHRSLSQNDRCHWPHSAGMIQRTAVLDLSIMYLLHEQNLTSHNHFVRQTTQLGHTDKFFDPETLMILCTNLT